MSKLKKRYRLKTANFSNTTGENAEKIIKCILPNVFLYQFITGNYYSKFIKTGNFSQRNTFCKKPTQMHTSQCLDLFVRYREGVNMSNVNTNPIFINEHSSFSQQSTSSPIVFDSVKYKFYFFL